MNRYVLSLACLAGLTPLFGQAIVLSPGADVQTAVNSAAAGATLALNPGPYTLSGTLTINKPITIMSNTPGTFPVLQLPGGTIVGIDIKANNVTLDWLRVTGSTWGVYAGNPGSTQISGVTLRNLSINAIAGSNPGHGIYMGNVGNAVIDSNTIEAAPMTGIIIDAGSSNATVINNNVSAAVHGIGITNSDSAIVAGNTLTSAGQFGIILVASKFSRVDRNTITAGVKQDGVVVTRDDGSGALSQSNYIGRNSVTSNGLATSNPDGTGIWLNSQSNGTLVYGNTTSGAPENGVTNFNTSNSWFWGNVTSNNGHGGIFVYGPTGLPYSTGPAPSNNFIQGNYAFGLPTNAGINLNLSSNSVVSNNAVRTSPEGIRLQSTSGNQIFLNVLHNDVQGIHAYSGATSSNYFLNKHLNSMADQADGGSSVTFDGGAVFGGNYEPGGKVLTDAYPYTDEQLGRTPSVSVTLPVAGTFASIGSRKTIEWRSTACSYVDIYYKSAGTGQQVIASDYPDVGVYQWTVPAIGAAADYTIVVDCNNSAGASLGVSASSGIFSVTTAGFELLSPQGNHRVTAGSTTKVAWKRSAGVTNPVNVFYRSTPGGGLVSLATNVAGNDATVTVPAGGTAQGSFVVQTAGASISDSSDGFVNVTDTTPSVTAPSGTLGIGTLQLLQWKSHSSSYYLDIEYWDPAAAVFRTIVTNLPDFGRFYFLVPDKAMTGSYLRVRFKNASLAAITTANSGTFNSAVAGSPGGGGGTTPPPAASLPDVVSLTPSSGTGPSGTFTATFRHPGGISKHYLGYILFLPTPNIVSFQAQGSCLIEYNRISNGMRLIDNAGTGWLGPIEGVPVTSSTPPLSNNACTVNVAGTAVSLSGTDMVISVPVTFNTAAVTQVVGTFIQEDDVNGNWTDFRQFGNWIVPGAPTKTGPFVVGATPTSGAGSSATFAVTVGHTSGTPTISNVHIRFNTAIVGGTPCHAVYFANNTIALINDAGTALVGPVAVGAPVTTGRCSIATGWSRSMSGNTLTLNLPMTFSAASFGGAKNVYVNVFDIYGAVTHWVQTGTWTVQ
jgi:parallel beta-helix repeat protein